MFERMHLVALLWGVALGWAAPAAEAQTPEKFSHIEVNGMPSEVAQAMTDQVAAWNRADLPGFMNGYWESDSLMFVGSSGLT